jgi:cation transport ATPase
VFWGILTALLIFLGVNKQLDLQTFLTLTMRRLAIAQGWYENRRMLQAIFVAAIAAAGILSAVAMRGLMRRHSELRLPVVGFVLLLAFVVIRAASFHHVDQLINFRLGGLKMNWLLEIGAIALVAYGAAIQRPDGDNNADNGPESLLPAR